MGCDIHLYVETLNPETSQWEFQPEPEHVSRWVDRDGDARSHTYRDWYSVRDYNLFALLADVRNGYGFAGVYTGEPITPLDEPRGIPDDASARYRQIAGDEPCCERYRATDWGSHEPGCHQDSGWGEDGHSHTWFTLRELQTSPLYDQEKISGGVVSVSEYLRWRDEGRPQSWSGGVSGPGIEIVGTAEMEARVAADPTLAEAVWPHARLYTTVRWKTSLREAISPGWFTFLDSLNRFTLDDGSDVRVVLFFDN